MVKLMEVVIIIVDIIIIIIKVWIFVLGIISCSFFFYRFLIIIV